VYACHAEHAQTQNFTEKLQITDKKTLLLNLFENFYNSSQVAYPWRLYGISYYKKIGGDA
jgi:hypothetical protein